MSTYREHRKLAFMLPLVLLWACQAKKPQDATLAAVEACGNQAQARYEVVQADLQQCRLEAINRYGDALEACGDPDPELDNDIAWSRCIRAAVDKYNADRERCANDANQQIQQIINDLRTCVRRAVGGN